MNRVPENEFGLRDVVAIIVFVIAFILFAWLLPDQKWLTESVAGLLMIRIGLSAFISALCWFATLKFLVPSDQEIIDLDVKRQKDGGLREVEEDAAEIKSTGFKLGPEYSDRVVSLGETIGRIHKSLKDEDLGSITKVEGKLFRFVNLLVVYLAYEQGAKRTTPTRFAELKATFESALTLTITAMDNLEFNMTDPDLSKAKVWEKTLEDLYEIDGLLLSKSSRNATDAIKRRSE
ncbi:TPA: hypothetical protein DIU27_05400 [Candidatus Collierbacteria bacterium]|uniref:Uncharacterized protein n=1 Tax=Candidatus Collierbacteria bacterium GW2011_GWB2_44_22 TaxID=1618387 RepID=A0A0G1KVG2_9BACT|nr:MAG: hypothetical protein UW31_C0002G0050 [Candidatus Collierbacteria bacterium GW2011_GWA2_44_13]KKT51909.1 MAG: hypothetical protein UW44_C0006G0027 [Candidatus Collierbacteria bacterium GW2011_GWB2_44_22]KKT61879.1 MAG: hypothetical protein UW56_C0016G0013 [Candidatus Collierbacteria bacterium GW2011_GWD1_44_27]KKT66167.1 MAG: hypothetical protein UW58_C0012G0009 [Candidatus Collierbacteria bacterium GW2011_GWC2_44_30]KKT68837.1 MAG: hypothetical protein UW64_C0009G0049 [Microgenomates gr